MKKFRPISFLFLALFFANMLYAQTSSDKANLQQAVSENDPAGIATVLNASPGLINTPNEDGWTPLLSAAYSGKTKAVQILLDRGASVDVKDPDGETALSLATSNGHADIVAMLLKKGAKPNTPNEKGETPLFQACAGGRMECFKLLLDAHGDIKRARETDDMTPLDAATQAGYTAIVQILIEHGASVTRATHSPDGPEDGYTPLHYAAEGGHVDLCNILLDHGANVNARSAIGNEPIHLAATWRGNDSVITLLLAHGASANALNNYHQTPMILATWEDRIITVVQLMHHGGDPNIGDSAGDTPLHLASHAGRIEMAWDLIHEMDAAGAKAIRANPNVQNALGQTPVMFAVQGDYDPLVDSLLTGGADPNIKDKHGRNALYYFAPENFEYIAHILIEHGASMADKDNDGMTPAEFYRKQGNMTAVKYLNGMLH
jgi:ankyrin repeat protein